MKSKSKIFIFSAFFIVLLLSINPELFSVGLFIDAVGLDILIFLFQVQIVTIVSFVVNVKIKPVFIFLYKILMRIDPYFFIPTKEFVLQYPPILLHAVPGLLSLYWLIFLTS